MKEKINDLLPYVFLLMHVCNLIMVWNMEMAMARSKGTWNVEHGLHFADTHAKEIPIK